MHLDNLDKIEPLKRNKKTLEKAITTLEIIINKQLDEGTEGMGTDNQYHVNPYNLVICEYGDGSGFKVNLTRYGDNLNVLRVIVDELAKQLENTNTIIETL